MLNLRRNAVIDTDTGSMSPFENVLQLAALTQIWVLYPLFLLQILFLCYSYWSHRHRYMYLIQITVLLQILLHIRDTDNSVTTDKGSTLSLRPSQQNWYPV